MPGFKRIRKKIKYQLIYWLIKYLLWSSNITPRRVWLWFCGVLGIIAYYFSSKSRNLVRRHLGIAFPEKAQDEIKRMSRNVFKMLGKNAGDVLRASASVRTLSDLDKIMVTHGYENFEVVHKRGNGIVFISPHLGAFDLQVTNMALRGWNPNIIGTPLKDERLNELLWKYRNRYGAIAIQRGKETFRMIKALKSGGSVALLIDQDTKVKSVFVNFFGKPAATPVGATILAMKTGAAVVPAYIHLEKDGMQHMHFCEEIPMRITGDEESDIVYNTQLMTSAMEDMIRKYPEQWVWMHERWKTKPGQEIK